MSKKQTLFAMTAFKKEEETYKTIIKKSKYNLLAKKISTNLRKSLFSVNNIKIINIRP